MKNKFIVFLLSLLAVLSFNLVDFKTDATAYANSDEELDYYTVYDAETNDVLFLKGDNVSVNDEYISADNKRYIIEVVDDEERTGKAKYIENVKMPVFNVTKKAKYTEVSAQDQKRIGLYHTHNDECYNDVDGTDSVYGKGGIHDVGAKLKTQLESLGVNVYYDESLHLPHDSGAYSRSLSTASNLLRNDLDAIFDVHRDATPRKEYITEVDGVTMSKVRMVVGSANANSAVNKEFALTIKAYADEVYPGLIKDIYIGKGNYNQQLFSRSMLFEFGTNTIEKEYVLRSCVPLAKTIDVVLYGTNNASQESLSDIDQSSSTGDMLETGMVGAVNNGENTNAGLGILWIVLIALGGIALIFGLIMLISKKARYGVKRFFSELTAGMFKKRNRSKA